MLVAYARLMAEYAQQMQPEVLQQLTSGLVELAASNTTTGFVSAGAVETSVESMLMDGAVDQTHAFNRQQHIQLTGAKIDQLD